MAIISIFIFNILLLSSYSHKNFFILIIFTIWIFDTFSYLGGSIIKGKKIFPNISKGKTYSGLISGIFGVTVIYFFFKEFSNQVNIISYPIILSIITLSFIGDAIVSFLKRTASLKDTGNLIPGHGGFLDRLDSFIFVFFVFGIYYFISS